ncbi:unnamed protein product, partial [Amoebophrya sp. A120]
GFQYLQRSIRLYLDLLRQWTLHFHKAPKVYFRHVTAEMNKCSSVVPESGRTGGPAITNSRSNHNRLAVTSSAAAASTSSTLPAIRENNNPDSSCARIQQDGEKSHQSSPRSSVSFATLGVRYGSGTYECSSPGRDPFSFFEEAVKMAASTGSGINKMNPGGQSCTTASTTSTTATTSPVEPDVCASPCSSTTSEASNLSSAAGCTTTGSLSSNPSCSNIVL